MEIPVETQVECTDGVCGRSVYVLIDPVAEEITHVVVKTSEAPHEEYLVPVDDVLDTIEGTIRLKCSKADLAQYDLFARTEVIEQTVATISPGASDTFLGYGLGSYYYWPYTTVDKTIYVPVEHQQIPYGELAVRRGLRAEATDGSVGQVDEFVVDPETSHITHLVLREGHLWGGRDVIIPVSALGEVTDETVHLKLTKEQVGSLPTFPVHRRWT